MEKMNDLKDLLRHEVQDLYSAEEQIIAALPLMIEKANNADLKKALQNHLRVTQQQRSRLEQVQNMLSTKENTEESKGLLSRLFKGRQVCKGMHGLIEEGNKVIREDMHPDVLDAAIISCTQKIEHYEICGYGTARTFARELNLEQVAMLLEQTLNEEYDADKLLTNLAVSRINKEAEMASSEKGTSGQTQRRGAGARDLGQERARRTEPEMEMVSSGRRTSAAATKGTTATGRGGAAPKSGEIARSSTSANRNTASSKRSTPAAASRKDAKSTRRNERSSNTGRRGGDTSRSRGR